MDCSTRYSWSLNEYGLPAGHKGIEDFLLPHLQSQSFPMQVFPTNGCTPCLKPFHSGEERRQQIRIIIAIHKGQEPSRFVYRISKAELQILLHGLDRFDFRCKTSTTASSRSAISRRCRCVFQAQSGTTRRRNRVFKVLSRCMRVFEAPNGWFRFGVVGQATRRRYRRAETISTRTMRQWLGSHDWNPYDKENIGDMFRGSVASSRTRFSPTTSEGRLKRNNPDQRRLL